MSKATMITKPRFEITDMTLLEGLGRSHLTLEEIATHLGCSYETYNERSKENPKISEAVNRGRINGKLEMVKKAVELTDEGNTAAILFMLKCKYGFNETVNLANADEKPLKLQIEYLNGNGEAQSD